MPNKPKQVTLIIPDTHAPFEHPKAIQFLKRLRKRWKPSRVIHIGDLIDHYQMSSFIKRADSLNIDQELSKAEKFVKSLAKVFPIMDVCMGNHCNRYLKKAAECGLSDKYLKPFPEIIGAPSGWTFGDEFVYDGITYLHGDGFTGLGACQNMIKTKFHNTVFGHTHQAGIQYLNGLWAMNVGCLIDHKTYAFEYSKFFKTKPTLGAGVVVNDGSSVYPVFVPLD